MSRKGTYQLTISDGKHLDETIVTAGDDIVALGQSAVSLHASNERTATTIQAIPAISPLTAWASTGFWPTRSQIVQD
jgi:hypothetical protein